MAYPIPRLVAILRGVGFDFHRRFRVGGNALPFYLPHHAIGFQVGGGLRSVPAGIIMIRLTPEFVMQSNWRVVLDVARMIRETGR